MSHARTWPAARPTPRKNVAPTRFVAPPRFAKECVVEEAALPRGRPGIGPAVLRSGDGAVLRSRGDDGE